MVGMSIEQLASASGLSAATIETLENGQVIGEAHTVLALRHALEAAGIIFIASGNQNEGGPGVRLKDRTGADEGIRPENLSAANDG